jgi:undecaprenyl-diphosphatase
MAARGRRRRYQRRPREDTAALVVGVVVLVICSLVAADGVPEWEADVFHAINDLPDWLRPLAWVVQLAGMMGIPFILAAVALFLRRWRLALALLLLTPIKLFLEHELVKTLIERQRPAITICNGDLSCGNFRGAPLQGLSYVSGHAIILGGLVWLLLPYLGRRGRTVVVVIALAALTARVYIGAHNPLDVVGGAGLGVAIAAALNLLLGVPARWEHARGSRRRRSLV